MRLKVFAVKHCLREAIAPPCRREAGRQGGREAGREVNVCSASCSNVDKPLP
jgi:hypothetical protein